MLDTDKTFVNIILDVMEQKGVRDAVCSPGSRNAPLLIGLAARDSIRKHPVLDERSAAFQALGISMVSKRPVALICTSGTALLDYAPGVAEAFYQGVPLIVISADRPIQWIDQDDSQTLRQYEALSNFVKRSYNLPAYGQNEKELQWFANRIINDAIATAISGKPGPVHVNIELSEPLGNKIKREKFTQRIIDTIEADTIGNKEIIKKLADELSHSRVLLVAGFLLPDAALQKAVAAFAGFPNVAVMAETLSNLHLKEEDHSIDSVLTSLSEEDLKRLAPDIVISIGGALVSRKLKEYLRNQNNNVKHWSVGYSNSSIDPFMSLHLRTDTEPARFFRNITAALRKKLIKVNLAEFSEEWKQARMRALISKTEFIDKAPWCELRAFSVILKEIPGRYNLFLSNGTPVRYAQLINYVLPHGNYCNRGVSGIEGSVSTAIGGAKAYPHPTLIITGDLSLAYDVDSLGISEVPDNFKIIVIDNQGGGIFRFIGSTSSLEEREKYFCIPQNLPLKQLAQAYGWDFFEAENLPSLIQNLHKFFSNGRKAILRVTCDGKESAEILKRYMTIKNK